VIHSLLPRALRRNRRDRETSYGEAILPSSDRHGVSTSSSGLCAVMMLEMHGMPSRLRNTRLFQRVRCYAARTLLSNFQPLLLARALWSLIRKHAVMFQAASRPSRTDVFRERRTASVEFDKICQQTLICRAGHHTRGRTGSRGGG
jgi:hypothetical protein